MRGNWKKLPRESELVLKTKRPGGGRVSWEVQVKEAAR
jgi:hypothetical protein